MKPMARIGDQLETELNHPYPHTVRMTLQTAQSCAYANELLAGGIGGWTLRRQGQADLPQPRPQSQVSPQ